MPDSFRGWGPLLYGPPVTRHVHVADICQLLDHQIGRSHGRRTFRSNGSESASASRPRLAAEFIVAAPLLLEVGGAFLEHLDVRPRAEELGGLLRVGRRRRTGQHQDMNGFANSTTPRPT